MCDSFFFSYLKYCNGKDSGFFLLVGWSERVCMYVCIMWGRERGRNEWNTKGEAWFLLFFGWCGGRALLAYRNHILWGLDRAQPPTNDWVQTTRLGFLHFLLLSLLCKRSLFYCFSCYASRACITQNHLFFPQPCPQTFLCRALHLGLALVPSSARIARGFGDRSIESCVLPSGMFFRSGALLYWSLLC